MRVAFKRDGGGINVRRGIAYVSPRGDHLALISVNDGGDEETEVERNAKLLNVEEE